MKLLKNILLISALFTFWGDGSYLYAQLPLINNDQQVTSPERFSSAQDTAFKQAMRLMIPPEIRFSNDLRESQIKWQLEISLQQGIPLDAALRDLERRYPDLYKPLPVEVVQFKESRLRSQYVPFTRTIDAGGMQIPLSAIGKFLGLVEDLSPIIRYTLDYTTKVQVVIYNMQGIVIAVLAEERQPAGNYVYNWNGKNDDGILQPPGDYIGEVRIGIDKYVRKHIEIK
ncbi:MAG: FlgD immunoglobulin-like domain containing protein [bacterium]